MQIIHGKLARDRMLRSDDTLVWCHLHHDREIHLHLGMMLGMFRMQGNELWSICSGDGCLFHFRANEGLRGAAVVRELCRGCAHFLQVPRVDPSSCLAGIYARFVPRGMLRTASPSKSKPSSQACASLVSSFIIAHYLVFIHLLR